MTANANQAMTPRRDIGMMAQLRAAVDVLMRHRKVFLTTVAELNAMSDRELADLGIASADIRPLARQEARLRHP